MGDKGLVGSKGKGERGTGGGVVYGTRLEIRVGYCYEMRCLVMCACIAPGGIMLLTPWFPLVPSRCRAMCGTLTCVKRVFGWAGRPWKLFV